MTNGPSPPCDPELELRKLQFDYAWKWFSYHADQRVKMFNFMLVALGIFAAAIVSAITYHMAHRATAILCFVAGILALVFGFLDMRNRNLVLLGEEVLMALERESHLWQRQRNQRS
jgi:Flp pilus assembly protein TadB